MHFRDAQSKVAWLAALFFIAAFGLLAFGIWKENVRIILVGVVVLILGALVTIDRTGFARGILALFPRIREIGPEGIKFFKPEEGSESTSDPTDMDRIVQNLQSRLNVSEEEAKEILDKVLYRLSQGLILEDPEDRQQLKEGNNEKKRPIT